MNYFLWDRDGYERVFNCNVLTPAQWEAHKSPNLIIGIVYIIMATLYQVSLIYFFHSSSPARLHPISDRNDASGVYQAFRLQDHVLSWNCRRSSNYRWRDFMRDLLHSRRRVVYE